MHLLIQLPNIVQARQQFACTSLSPTPQLEDALDTHMPFLLEVDASQYKAPWLRVEKVEVHTRSRTSMRPVILRVRRRTCQFLLKRRSHDEMASSSHMLLFGEGEPS